MAASKIQFAQGLNVGVAGQALIGTTGAQVIATNDNNNDVLRWKWTWIATPPGSAIVVGSGQDGGLSSYVFTPDKRGGYLLELTVFDAAGKQIRSRLAFQVAETSGLIIPPFDADASALTFGGQTRGWAPMMEPYLAILDALLTQGLRIPIVTGVQRVTNTSPQRIGVVSFDFSQFPASIGTIGTAKQRQIRLRAILESEDAAADAKLDLYDLDHGIQVSSSEVNNSAVANPLLPEECFSSALAVGTSSGNLRTDGKFRYLCRLYRDGGTNNVTCSAAWLEVKYA